MCSTEGGRGLIPNNRVYTGSKSSQTTRMTEDLRLELSRPSSSLLLNSCVCISKARRRGFQTRGHLYYELFCLVAGEKDRKGVFLSSLLCPSLPLMYGVDAVGCSVEVTGEFLQAPWQLWPPWPGRAPGASFSEEAELPVCPPGALFSFSSPPSLLILLQTSSDKTAQS